MRIVILVFLFAIGAAMGSFVCCQARRERRNEEGKKKLGKRSVCLSCGYQLRWYDNIPIVSWLSLGGKCRKCHKKIGVVELVAEIVLGVVFLVVGIVAGNIEQFAWVDWLNLCMTLVFATILLFLAIYDGLWGELPQKWLLAAVICGAVIAILKVCFLGGNVWSALVGIGILGGVYYLLFFLSKGELVGSGDWIMGLAIALALGDAWLALLVMFISNALAAIVMLPVVKFKKNTKIYFGPWMAIGYAVVLISMKTLMNIF